MEDQEPQKDRQCCGITLTRRRKICLFVCIGLTVLILAIMIPVAIFVIGPNIAQHSIDSSKLTFDNAAISNPTEGSFLMSSTGSVVDAGSLDATIEFPGPVDIYWTARPDAAEDLLLGNVQLPPLSVSGAAPKSGKLEVTDAQVTITNLEGMATFSAFLIKGSSFSWRIKGKAQAKALGLTFGNLNMDKVVTLAGFDGLNKVSIDKFDLPDSDPTAGIRLSTETTLINPSAITIELGDLYFSSSYNNRSIGTLQGSNITLTPGSNKLMMNGRLTTIDPKDTQALSDVFTMFVGGVGSQMKVTGQQVISNGVAVSWLNKGFVGLDLFVTLNPPSAQKMRLISDLKIPAIEVSFSPQNPSGFRVRTTAPTINGSFKSPFAFPLSIISAAQDLTFSDPSSKVAFATLKTPMLPASANQRAGTLVTSFKDMEMAVIPGAESTFSSFLRTLTVGEGYTAAISGLVNSQADTAAGRVTISNVSLSDSLQFSGLRGLNQVSINSVSVKSGDADAIYLEIGTTINNPSTMTLNMNTDVSMDLLSSDGHKLGTVTLPNLSLRPGQNNVLTTSRFSPQTTEAKQAGKKILSAFLQGGSSDVSILGTRSGVLYDSLKPAFDGLRIPANMPGQTTPLIKRTWLNTDHLFDEVNPYVEVSMELRNPLDSPFTLTRVYATITKDGKNLGVVDTPVPPFRVNPKSEARTPLIPMKVDLNPATITFIIEALGSPDGLIVDVQSTLQSLVGGYGVEVDYGQKGVSTLFDQSTVPNPPAPAPAA
ncbi:hypothetical protein HDV05_002538 [Chytridiales sp. JEL 0842]|nr:hypothetical protein HDV05_002538 [Chytridiales sp. JEL 0842]